jgi:uncharacterized protein
MIKDFSHFKGNKLTRSEKIQKKITEYIIKSKIPDEKRDSSVVWEQKHSAGVCQMGRLLAQKRDLNIEIAEIICIMHDIYTIITGSYKNHGPEGAKIAQKILMDSGDFSQKEIITITQAISQHSNKDHFSNNPYAELVKDADLLDCSLYENSLGGYKLHKSDAIYKSTLERLSLIRKELNLPAQPILRK